MIQDLAITSLETITAFDVVTGAYRFTLDELQNASVAQSQEEQDITGRQGRLINSLKRNKAVTVSGTNGLVSGGLLEAQTGSDFVSGNTNVKWVDYLTVNASNKVALTYKAVGTAGSEIEKVYVKNTDGTIDTVLEQATAAAAGKFAYNATSKEITFHTDIAEGTEVVVYYDRKIAATVQENMSDNYSAKLQLYIDALAEDKCSNVYRVQIYIPKADFSGNFTLDFGDNQSVHAFEARSLANVCGGSANLWTYTVFDSDAEDVEEGD